MFEKLPKNDLEDNDLNSQENFSVNNEPEEKERVERLQYRDEKLEEVYEKINNAVKQHKAEFRTASLDLLGGIGGIFEKMGK